MKKLSILIFFLASLVMPGCNEYLDINKDPNNPSDVDHTTLIPTIELYGTYSFCASTGFTGDLQVYTHQITTREDANEYGVTGSDYIMTYAWRYLYVTTLQNLELALEKAESKEDKFSTGMLKILKGYYYSMLVDLFGNVPYTEACQAVQGIKYPKYDKGEEIYPQLIDLIDEGIADLESGNVAGGAYDIIYGGNAQKWVKAANTIKLKLYVQTRKVWDNKAKIEALLNSGKLISSTEEGMMFYFGTSNTPDERHPAYPGSYAATPQTDHISPWFFEILKGINPIFKNIEDPRIPYYFYNQLEEEEESEADCEYRYGGFVSIYFGSKGNRRDIARDNDLTVPGIYPLGGRYDEGKGGVVKKNPGTGAAPFRYLTYADLLFLKAELINVGIISGDQSEVLKSAIKESFKTVDYVVSVCKGSQDVPVLASSKDADTYLNKIMDLFGKSDNQKKLEIIMTQKWIQSFGNSVDQYTDYRRTGYPVMFDPAAFGNTITPPAGGDPSEELPAVPVSCSVKFPASFPYVQDDLSSNQNAPEQKNDLANQKVFWDK